MDALVRHDVSSIKFYNEEESMRTVEEAKSWVETHTDELEKAFMGDPEIPAGYKAAGTSSQIWRVYSAAEWLDAQLRIAGASEQEVKDICFAVGQRGFSGDPFEWAVKYLNEFESRGIVADKPGATLAQKIIEG